MAHSCTENTSNIWKLIDFHHSCGKSIQNIAKLDNLFHSTVQYMIKHLKEENQIKKNKKWLSKLTKCDTRFITRKVLKYPCLNDVKLTAEFNEQFSTSISPETVWRVFRAHGLNGYSAYRKFFVCSKSRKLRLLFTKSIINSKCTRIMFYLQTKVNLTFLVLMIVQLWGEEKMSNLVPRT